MSDIATSFGISVSDSSILQSYLTTSTAATSDASGILSSDTTTSSSSAAVSILGGSSTTTTTGGAVYNVLNGTSSTVSATSAALGSGRLTTTQHKVIQAIGTAGTTGLAIDYNKTGTEPSVLSSLRTLGWIQLKGKTTDPDNGLKQGVYTLTTVGKAIYKRTGGAAVGGSGTLSNALLNGDSTATSSSTSTSSTSSTAAAVNAQLSSSLSTATSLLASLGVNITA